MLDDFGELGRAYRETDEKKADLDSVIERFLDGQYQKPVRVVAFNTAEGWARDVSEDVAWAVLKRSGAEARQIPNSTREFVVFYVGEVETLHALL